MRSLRKCSFTYGRWVEYLRFSVCWKISRGMCSCLQRWKPRFSETSREQAVLRLVASEDHHFRDFWCRSSWPFHVKTPWQRLPNRDSLVETPWQRLCRWSSDTSLLSRENCNKLLQTTNYTNNLHDADCIASYKLYRKAVRSVWDCHLKHST